MASIKKIHQNGGVYLRVIHKRKKKLKLVFRLDDEFWNGDQVKKTHPNSKVLNRLLSSKFNSLEKKLYELEITGKEYTIDQIFDLRKDKLTVCAAMTKRINGLKDKITYARKIMNLKEHFESFGDMPVESFDIEQMRLFEEYLIQRPKIKSLETVARYLKDLKGCLRRVNYNNFEVMSYTLKHGHVTKPKLYKDEIQSIIDLNNQKLNLTKDIFLACFYSWGTRIGDVLQLKPQDIKGDRLIFIEQKGQKQKSVKINDKLKGLIEKYKDQSVFYIFPKLTLAPSDPRQDLRYREHIKTKTAEINRELKLIAILCNIDKHLTTHVARHSFSAQSIKSGVSVHVLSKMLNHSSISITEQYLRGLNLNDELDEAANSIY